ncbi:hypothetical protein D3C75_941480 [compost metagenome]
MVFVGTQPDDIETFPVFVRHRIGANLLQFALQPTVDRVVVGGELHRRFLSRSQKRDVLRANFGFHQQLIVKRDNLHQVVTRLDHAADSVHQQLLHHTPHRRGHQRAVDPVGDGFTRGLDFAEIGAGFVKLPQRLAAVTTARFAHLTFNLFDGGLCTRDRQNHRVQLSLGFNHSTAQTQHLHL